MFDVIERLKSEWTDKYVVINSSAPELARFANATGTVKTVNMNGRCLVEFDQFNNIGWYDIDPSALRIVTEPRPKPVETEPAKPAAAKAAPAAAKPAAKPAAGRPSTADILAAARAKAAGGAAPAAKPAADKPAGKPSTAEILARARAAKAPPAAAEPEPQEADASAEAAPAPAAAAPAKKAAPAGSLPTTTADKIAWCRQHDAKG
ncbi:MAG: hypothetical protein RLZZ111_1257 [Planctomycetota bacterium]|jgi:hypothetical protein